MVRAAIGTGMIPETTVIGNRYRLHERLGAGGMGAVFRAEDRLTGQMLALKRVSLPDAPEEDTLDHLRVALSHEFRTLASLRHPNIISVIDYGFRRAALALLHDGSAADARTLTSPGSAPRRRSRRGCWRKRCARSLTCIGAASFTAT
ncbi:MAG: hypothetical protein IPK17_21790 [Chloroflexi bacterium]|nr:hypothetical protein [Chloroflexota bacterium]